MHGSYSSQFLRIPAGMVAEKLTFVFPESKRGTGGVLAAYENGTWLFTAGRVDGGEPPGDLAGMIGLAAEFMPPGLVVAVKAGEPRGEACVAHNIRGVWRRYDKMPAFPAGLLVFGDAICSLNPIYGQGMTVAALEAVALRDCLSGGDADLSLRFFRAAAGLIRPLWSYNQARDRYMCPDGSISQRLINWRMDKRVAAAENDPAMTERLFRVGQLLDPPSVLLRPAWMRRVGLRAVNGFRTSLPS